MKMGPDNLAARVCLFVLPFSLSAQNMADKPEGAAVLSPVKQAMGGARWDDIQTLHAKGRVEIGELQGSYESWLDLRRLYSYQELRFSHPGSGGEEYLAGSIGNKILRQYKITLDYGHAAAYLERDQSYKGERQWTYSRSQQDRQKRGNAGDLGFVRLAYRLGDAIEILGIDANSAASHAGLKRGDAILAIDGIPVRDLSTEQQFDHLFLKSGAVVKLIIRRGNATRDVTLTM